ncbi:hypothetical protein C8J57DRAFT_1607543, partial [Mycena rebaudengoi]
YALPLLKAALNTKQAVNPISYPSTRRWLIPSQITTMTTSSLVTLWARSPERLVPGQFTKRPASLKHAQAQPASRSPPLRLEHPNATGRRGIALQVNHPVSHTFAVTSHTLKPATLPPSGSSTPSGCISRRGVLPPSLVVNLKTQAALPSSSVASSSVSALERPTPESPPLYQKPYTYHRGIATGILASTTYPNSTLAASPVERPSSLRARECASPANAHCDRKKPTPGQSMKGSTSPHKIQPLPPPTP